MEQDAIRTTRVRELWETMKLVNQAINFFRTRRDWLGGSGEPVPVEVAQKRADSCLMGNEGKICPHNREMPLFQILTGAAARSVIAQLNVKEHMGLRLRREESLFTCDVCMCSNRLKPWTPGKYIHVSFRQDEIPPWCWMHELFDNQTSGEKQHDNSDSGLPK